jgi:hypothetical protein
MSSTILAVVVNAVVALGVFLGVEVGTEQATATVQTLVAIGTGAWVWYQRRQLRRIGAGEETDVTIGGLRRG